MVRVEKRTRSAVMRSAFSPARVFPLGRTRERERTRRYQNDRVRVSTRLYSSNKDKYSGTSYYNI